MDITSETISPHLRIQTIFDGILISSRGYSIFKSNDFGKTWFLSGTLPVPGHKKFLSKSGTMSKALRIGIHQIKQIHNGKILISCDNGFFLSDQSLSDFHRINLNSHSFQLLDHNFCETSKFTYFGEYFYNFKKNKVNIFRTSDGEKWEIIYSFPKKSVKHIHLLQFDPFTEKIWFSTGDADSECIFGYANDDFSDIEIVGKNDQDWRCLELIFTPEKVYWGTDNPDGQNWLISLDRHTHTLQKIAPFNGPVYNLKRFFSGYIVMTATEGGRGERDNRAHVLFTTDLEKSPWEDCISYKKDWMPLIFGFGRLYFAADYKNFLFLYGLALKNIDRKSIVLSFNEPAHVCEQPINVKT
jgi:hypothetical protein